jgi:GNAT superfamily N-acetyltransferase
MEDIEVSNSNDDAQYIRQKLDEYNCTFAQPDNHERLCLIVRRRGNTIGGLLGGTYWNWLYIELFWVDENERSKGMGTTILEKAEEIAVRRGCQSAHLETHDFQSLEFYKRRGYSVFGELTNLPEGHTKFYLCKQLVKSPQRAG